MDDTTASRPQDHPLESVRRHMDAHAGEPLSLSDLAARSGFSPFHFVRMFAARYGASPMAYLRDLRLQAAAARLANEPAAPLIELAFDSGFETQEGFTRAFSRAFGVTPGRFRTKAVQTQETDPMTTIERPTLSQSAGPVQKPALRMAGIGALFDDETKFGIPALWNTLLATPGVTPLLGGRTFGVCSAAPDGAEGAMRYVAAVELPPGAPIPESLEIVELPPRPYLVMRQVLEGPDLHPQMQAAAKEIWGERIPRSGATIAQAPDLEVYPPGFDPNRPGAWVEWWIPTAG